MPAILKILFLAAEAEPFIKIGGLADVAGALPLALRLLPRTATNGLKLDVRLVLPLHRQMRSEAVTLRPAAKYIVPRQGGGQQVEVLKTYHGGMPVYFIKGEPISSATFVYSSDPDLDREKFAFFSLAALELPRHIDWQPDILHANDWHTAMAVYALRLNPLARIAGRPRSILTLHNLPYMGGDATDVLTAYGLNPPTDEALPPWAQTQLLPLGLLAADAVVPVSPGYAREILTPAFGCGLDDFLRGRSDSITGILNGLDVDTWNPETDKALPATFEVESLSKRAENKAALQKHLGLEQVPRIPLLAMVGRFASQKGVDITLQALRLLAGRAWQFVILGSGDPVLENAARALEAEFPKRVRAAIRFDAPLSRLIYGGADMFLMPSRYEPCGLAQMIAMRYGCVPVVHATGGLKDTVQEGKTGVLFQAAEAGAMVEALERAFSVYPNAGQWEHFQRCGMLEDFSWARFAARYAIIYRSLMLDQPYGPF
jgi:starch synthase